MCSGPGTTIYKFKDETYTYFEHQSKTNPPPFDIFFDTETPINDDCVQPTLLLGSYAIMVVFSDNILVSNDNNLENFYLFPLQKNDGKRD